MDWLEWVKALLPLFLELVKVLAGPEYNEEDEKQAILKFNREVSDLRAKRELRNG